MFAMNTLPCEFILLIMHKEKISKKISPQKKHLTLNDNEVVAQLSKSEESRHSFSLNISFWKSYAPWLVKRSRRSVWKDPTTGIFNNKPQNINIWEKQSETMWITCNYNLVGCATCLFLKALLYRRGKPLYMRNNHMERRCSGLCDFLLGVRWDCHVI